MDCNVVFSDLLSRVESVESVSDFCVPLGMGPYKRQEPGLYGPGLIGRSTSWKASGERTKSRSHPRVREIEELLHMAAATGNFAKQELFSQIGAHPFHRSKCEVAEHEPNTAI